MGDWAKVSTLFCALCCVACVEETLEQQCNERPNRAGCLGPDGGVPEKSAGCGVNDDFCLTYYQLEQDGEPDIIGTAGQYATRIAWQLIKGGAPADGAVVQHITWEGEGLFPADAVGGCSTAAPISEEWWEIFPVDKDDILTDPRWDDWGNPRHLAPGNVEIAGRASYYSNAEMGSELEDFDRQGDGDSHPFAGTLRSTTEAPDFWSNNAKPRLVRAVELSWSSCAAGTSLDCSFTSSADDCE